MDESATRPILEKIRFYRSKAKACRAEAAENEKLAVENEKIAASWETVLSQIQTLQRQAQPAGKRLRWLVKENKKLDRTNRFALARDALRINPGVGMLPVEIRRLANQRGFSCPSNYPYKLLTKLVKEGKVRKDEETGRYFPIEGANLR